MLKLVCAFLASSAVAFNVLLPPYSEYCFYEELALGDSLYLSFQVGDRDPSSSDQLEASFHVTGPNDVPLKTLEHVDSGDASIEALAAGRYRYCFSNLNSDIATKDVTFHVQEIRKVDDEAIAPNTLEAEVQRLSRLMQEVKFEQEYLVIRERTHRNTAESTNARVKWWSLFQVSMVTVNSLFQIYYLRRFFEVKTAL